MDGAASDWCFLLKFARYLLSAFWRSHLSTCLCYRPKARFIYLGFGVVAPDVSLGLLISQYQDSFTSRPWLFWYPGFFIIAIALSVNFIGDGLRDAFDPRQRRRLSLKDRRAARIESSDSKGGE